MFESLFAVKWISNLARKTKFYIGMSLSDIVGDYYKSNKKESVKWLKEIRKTIKEELYLRSKFIAHL